MAFEDDAGSSPFSSTENRGSRTLLLSELLPPTAAYKGPGDSGETFGSCPSPWARWVPGLATSMWQIGKEESGIGKGKEQEKEKEKVHEKNLLDIEDRDDDELSETVILEGFEEGKEKESGKEKEKIKEKEKETEGINLVRSEQIEEVKEEKKKKGIIKEAGSKPTVEIKEKEMTKGVIKEVGSKATTKLKVPVYRKKLRKGVLSEEEAAWAKAREAGRVAAARLYPGFNKRKRGMNVRRGFESLEEKEKGKEKEKEEKEMEKDRSVNTEVLDKDIFIFGGGSLADMLWVKESLEHGDGEEDATSEIFFRGQLVQQVREVPTSPEPEEIKFLHKVHGRLSGVTVRTGLSLEEWYSGLHEGHGGLCMDGYFATLGGRILDAKAPVEYLGLEPGQEVVFQERLRGGGYGGGGKGSRVGGPNSVQAGDWTCSNCSQPGCWNARYSCYRCGAPRYPEQGGGGGQVAGNAQGTGGRLQGGVGTSMGGVRIIGPNGRDQTHTSSGEPTQRRAPQQGGNGRNRNKVGGIPGAGVGFGMGGGGVGGGRGIGFGGNAWLEGGSGTMGGGGGGKEVVFPCLRGWFLRKRNKLHFVRASWGSSSLKTN